MLLIRIKPPEPVDLAEAEADGVIFPAVFLQRILREAERHVDLAHLDAVLAGVADDLRRRVKPHRLRVQQPAAKRVGMIMLQPRRDVDQLRKARGMTFGKTIAAKALDLLEAAFGE